MPTHPLAKEYTQRYMDRHTGQVPRKEKAAVPYTVPWNSDRAKQLREGAKTDSSGGGGKKHQVPVLAQVSMG